LTSPLLPCPQPLIADLRPWQREARQLILTRPLRDRLIEAAPGGGKTRLLCTVARDLIGQGECDRVCVVVPTRALCEQ
jgi:superfamily II DNA or RNA helicase